MASHQNADLISQAECWKYWWNGNIIFSYIVLLKKIYEKSSIEIKYMKLSIEKNITRTL